MNNTVVKYNQKDIDEKYENSINPGDDIRKDLIENPIRGQLDRLIGITNKDVIDKWFINMMDETPYVPNELLNNISRSRLYINSIETSIIRLLNKKREQLDKEAKIINKKVIEKQLKQELVCKSHITHTGDELNVLKRVSILPDELIRYIAEYAFTEEVRLVIIQHKYSNIKQHIASIKNSILVKMIPTIRNLVVRFSNEVKKINKTSHLRKYIPNRSDIVISSISNIQYPRRINKTSLKSKKVESIENIILDFQNIIQYYKQFTKVSHKTLQKYLFHLYHTIIYISKHKCNKRGS